MKNLLRPNALTTLSLGYVLGILLVAMFPAPMALLLITLLPLVGIAVTIAVGYMIYVYWQMRSPRPIFFRMLLGSAVTKVAAGLSIGYIALASLGDRLHLFTLPLPGSQTQRTAYVILAIVIALTPPIWYALTIWSGRRRAGRSEFDEGDR